MMPTNDVRVDNFSRDVLYQRCLHTLDSIQETVSMLRGDERIFADTFVSHLLSRWDNEFIHLYVVLHDEELYKELCKK